MEKFEDVLEAIKVLTPESLATFDKLKAGNILLDLKRSLNHEAQEAKTQLKGLQEWKQGVVTHLDLKDPNIRPEDIKLLFATALNATADAGSLEAKKLAKELETLKTGFATITQEREAAKNEAKMGKIALAIKTQLTDAKIKAKLHDGLVRMVSPDLDVDASGEVVYKDGTKLADGVAKLVAGENAWIDAGVAGGAGSGAPVGGSKPAVSLVDAFNESLKPAN